MKARLRWMGEDIEVDGAAVEKILRRSAEIVQGGWCRGTFCRTPDPTIRGFRHWMGTDLIFGRPGVDQFCVQGALRVAHAEVMGLDHPGVSTVAKALQEEPEFSAAHDLLAQVIGTQASASWNDQRDRTRDQVVAALLEAADRASR